MDYFIIIKSPTTYTGGSKFSILKENQNRFASFHEQIMYHLVEDPSTATVYEITEITFGLDARNCVSKPGRFRASSTQGDVLVISDMDEIFRSEARILLKYCDVPIRLRL